MRRAQERPRQRLPVQPDPDRGRYASESAMATLPQVERRPSWATFSACPREPQVLDVVLVVASCPLGHRCMLGFDPRPDLAIR